MPISITLYSGPLGMYGAKAHIAALEKGLAVNLRPAVQPTLVQMIQTLTRQGHPVPQFMSDAVYARSQ